MLYFSVFGQSSVVIRQLPHPPPPSRLPRSLARFLYLLYKLFVVSPLRYATLESFYPSYASPTPDQRPFHLPARRRSLSPLPVFSRYPSASAPASALPSPSFSSPLLAFQLSFVCFSTCLRRSVSALRLPGSRFSFVLQSSRRRLLFGAARHCSCFPPPPLQPQPSGVPRRQSVCSSRSCAPSSSVLLRFALWRLRPCVSLGSAVATCTVAQLMRHALGSCFVRFHMA